MRNYIYTLAITGFFLAFTACNNPINKKFNENNLEKDLKEIVESKKADTTDIQFIAMYIMRAKMLGEKLEGKTYKDILENAKELRKKAETELSIILENETLLLRQLNTSVKHSSLEGFLTIVKKQNGIPVQTIQGLADGLYQIEKSINFN